MAVGYDRVSHARQSAQIFDQEASIRDFCATERLELIEMYDEGVSGDTSHKRAVLGRLIQRISDGQSGIGYLIVHSHSRLTRDALELEQYLQCLDLSGVKLVTVAPHISPTSLHADILSDSAERPMASL